MWRRIIIFSLHSIFVSRLILTKTTIDGTEDDDISDTSTTDTLKVNRSLPKETKAALQTVNVTQILGLTVRGDDVDVEEGIPEVQNFVETEVLFFGEIGKTSVVFTTTEAEVHTSCDRFDRTAAFNLAQLAEGVYSTKVILPLPNKNYYVCLLESNVWRHQGTDQKKAIMLRTKPPKLQVSLNIAIVILLLLLSGLFSGLNIGLMTLDKNELQVLAMKGNEDQRKYAKTILPVRRRGNFLLCSLLLGNVMVNSLVTIFMDELTTGLIAVTVSTALIVVFGEIVPQALCSRHGMVVGAKTIYVTYLLLLITGPISYPISLFLDFILGDEIGSVYDRERLKEYIQVTKPYNKLEEDEVNIITGTLELNKKTVGGVMTKLEDIYMVPITAKLNSEMVSEISKRGYSRIPVFQKERSNVVGLLYVKDIVLFATAQEIPITKVLKSTSHPLMYTNQDERLKVLLDQFKSGKCHMALVKAKDKPTGGIIGLITMEDVLEEILQSEIVDETDVLTDNRKKEVVKRSLKEDFADFLKVGEGRASSHYISPELFHATFIFLSTEVKPFDVKYISRTVLRRLIEQKIYYEVKGESDLLPKPLQHRTTEEKTLYTAGKPADYFILLVEGKVNMFIGKEQLFFECNSFCYFGTPAIEISDANFNKLESTITKSNSLNKIFANASFIPDYTVKTCDNCLYMKVTQKHYFEAIRATFLEKSGTNVNAKEIDEHFARNVDPKNMGEVWIKTVGGYKGKHSDSRNVSKTSNNSGSQSVIKK